MPDLPDPHTLRDLPDVPDLRDLPDLLDTVSTTCGSWWVRSHQAARCTATHPPATAGGTDCIQQRIQTVEAKPTDRIQAADTALEVVRVWLETAFEGGRHVRRIELLDAD